VRERAGLANYGWPADDEMIGNVDLLAGMPGVLVHGRLDLSCPLETAHEFGQCSPGAELFVCDESGHRASEATRAYLHAALARFADQNVN
jgi:proline iminopeptidase